MGEDLKVYYGKFQIQLQQIREDHNGGNFFRTQSMVWHGWTEGISDDDECHVTMAVIAHLCRVVRDKWGEAKLPDGRNFYPFALEDAITCAEKNPGAQ